MGLEDFLEHLLVKWRHHGLRLSGACGILAPIVAFSGIAIAMHYYPNFSWTDSALSDMGASDTLARPVCNSGRIFGGALCFAFSLGFSLFLKKGWLSRIGTAAFMLDSLMLSAIGVFPGDFMPKAHIHYYVSLAFFVLFPISAVLLTIAFHKSGRIGLAALGMVLAIIAAGVWIAHFTVYPFGKGVAIPEMVSATAAGLWALATAVSMVRASDE